VRTDKYDVKTKKVSYYLGLFQSERIFFDLTIKFLIFFDRFEDLEERKRKKKVVSYPINITNETKEKNRSFIYLT